MQKQQSSRSPFEIIGGAESVALLANRFYDIMESDPYAQELYAIHPKPLDNIRRVFTLYLTMWLGGPNEYEQERGHPRLRARHLPFKVTPSMKAQWMYCMRKAMHETVSDSSVSESLLDALNQLAEHMINTHEDE